MTTSRTRFDWLSPYYDWLTELVFRGTLQEAQRVYLNAIPNGATVLIIGAGTGWLSKELLHLNRSCVVYHIDASASMIRMAMEKIDPLQKNRIVFITGTEDSIPNGIEFDVVITHFFLDLFLPRTMRDVIEKLNGSLRKNGLWLVSDFVGNKWWQKIMLAVMYAFFRITCGVEAKELPDWIGALRQAELTETKSAYFCKSFIKSVLFVKAAH